MLLHRLDAAAVLVERRAADLHLHHRVAGIEMALHLVAQFRDALARRVPAAADIDEAFVQHLAARDFRQQHVQRLVVDLGDRVPHRHLDRADADRALRVPAGLFVAHHDGEDLVGGEIAAGIVEQRFRIRLQDARDEARAHLRAAGVAAGGIERKAGDRLAVAHDVGDHRDDRSGHLGEVDRGVLQRGVQRDGGFADVGDAHAATQGLQRSRVAPSCMRRGRS